LIARFVNWPQAREWRVDGLSRSVFPVSMAIYGAVEEGFLLRKSPSEPADAGGGDGK
jgi:CRISPR/Cas system CMR-associated protein Cmr3 (group 5 of RAMP superfamily)